MQPVAGAPSLGSVVSIDVIGGDPPAARGLERVLPTANVDLIINLAEDELRTYADDGTVRRHPGAVLSGPASRPRVIDTDETANLLVVGFRHGTASAFVGHPLHELTDAMVGLEELFGREGATLRERLVAASTRSLKVELVERMLITHLGRARTQPRVRLAVAALERGERVRAVSEQLDLSTKQLGRWFRDHVGVSPKQFSRLRRLQRVLRSAHAAPEPAWAALAAHHGYADQSHLIRDFRQLTGLTPTDYASLVTGEHNHVAFVLSGAAPGS